MTKSTGKKQPKLRFDRVKGGKETHLAVKQSLRQMTLEKLAYEWAVTGGDKSPTAWLRTKGNTDAQCNEILRDKPAAEWFIIRRAIQDELTYSLVKQHIDFVAEMNDTHIKAAKLGLAKAIDLMTRLKIEERRDKKGNVYFAGFRPADLARCMESIKTAQYIQRRALGLPNDEGAITTWQRIQHERTVKTAADGSTEATETVSVEGQAKSLAEAMSYDDIKTLIDAERRRKKEEAALGGKTIEAEAKPV